MELITQKIKSCQCTMDVKRFKNQDVILYGAGIDGFKVFTELKKIGINVLAFLDIRADLIKNIKNIPVLMPDHPVIPESHKAEIPVILTIKPFKPRDKAIINALNEQGYHNIVKAIDIFDFYGFTQNQISDFDQTTSSIIQCAHLLEDEASYSIFKGFIDAHASKNYDTFVTPTQNVKYFDGDFTENKGFQRFIDCGAFTGDTLRDLNRLKGKVEKLALFESDLTTYQQLVKNIGNDTEQYAEEMTLFPCGVWSDAAKLKANNGMELNSHISDDGDDIIQCVAIDQVLKGFKPTYIKMDVEGAEYQALLGAKRTISENKPDLVISLYHYLKDIWELPLFISSWNLGYKFYIRVYGNGGNSTMLYAFAD